MITSKLKTHNSKLLLCLLSFALCLVAGCGNQSATTSPDVMRRAKLLGNENIQLKREIAERDAKINELNQQISTLQAEMEANKQRQGETILKLMGIAAECQQKLKFYENK
jgi:uncharacterized protein YlxW (UPF0749 family)